MKQGKKIWIKGTLCAAALLLCMAGCKNAKRDYVDSDIHVGESGEDNKTGQTSGDMGDLYAMLQVAKDEKWSEEGSDGKKMYFNVVLPDYSYMCVQNFKEHYLTEKEKETYLSYFLDAGSIVLDVDNPFFPCRENLEARAQRYEQYIGEELNMDIDPDSETGLWLMAQRGMYERIREMIPNAQKKEEIDILPRDFSADYYAGTRGEIRYGVQFQSDEANRNSYIRVLPMDLEKLSPITGEEIKPIPCFYSHVTDNQCSMSEAEALRRAEGILEDLGLSDLQLYKSGGINWTDHWLDTKDVADGYAFWFSRSPGTGVLTNYLSYEYNYPAYAGVGSTPWYDLEMCVIELNDKGLIRFFYTGLLDPIDAPASVKLLSFENIKSVIADQRQSWNHSYQYNDVELIYTRIKGDMPGTFTILPVWVVKSQDNMTTIPANWNYMPYLSLQEDCLIINAIDGSVVDVYEEEIGNNYWEWKNKYIETYEELNYQY